jgi:hypothetical protein
MPTNTYTPLATLTLTGTDSVIEFASIPSTYRDLILVVNASVTGNGNFTLKLNNDSGNSTAVYMYGTGSGSGVSFTETNPLWALWVSGQQHIGRFQIMDYSATDKHKTFLTRHSNAGNLVVGNAGRWASTSAVTSLVFSMTSGNLSAGTTLALFGVAA